MASNSGAETGPQPAPSVAMLVYLNMILLDLVGPQTVFSILQADLRLVWKDKQPVTTDVGVSVTATDTFERCPVTRAKRGGWSNLSWRQIGRPKPFHLAVKKLMMCATGRIWRGRAGIGHCT